MKHTILIGIFITAIILVSGCKINSIEDDIICNSPYIRHGLACCLDTNDNNICDKDEGIEITAEEPEVEEEVEEETEEEEEEETVEIPEITAKLEGFEDYDIVLASGSVGNDVINMAIELATMISYDSDILTKDEFDITDYERIYLIKDQDEDVEELSDFIIAVGDDAPNSIVSKADDLAEGIDYTGDIKELDEIDFERYERVIFLVIES